MDSLAQFFKKHQIYKCKVAKINPTYVILETSGIVGICHISEVSDYIVKDIHKFFTVGETYSFMLIDFDENKKLYSFSYKRTKPKLLKHHSKIIPTPSGFDNLYKSTMQKLFEQEK